MDTPSATGMLSPQYEQALQLMADRQSSLNPTTMAKIARLLETCCDAEKCAAHFLMDNRIVGEDQALRFHWLLAKSCVPGCSRPTGGCGASSWRSRGSKEGSPRP